LLLEPCISLIYAWKTNKYTNFHSVYELCMVAPTCFGITLTSSGSIPSAFWEIFNWGTVNRILWMGGLCLVTRYISTRNAPWRWQCNANKRVGATIHNQWTEWIIGVFVVLSHIFLLEILIFKGLTVLRLYKSFDVKGLIR
jgi:hypothetical protein